MFMSIYSFAIVLLLLLNYPIKTIKRFKMKKKIIFEMIFNIKTTNIMSRFIYFKYNCK